MNRRTIIGVAIVTGGVLLPRVARACHEVNVCVKLGTVGTTDADAGDYPEPLGMTEVEIDGPHLRVAVIPPVPEDPFEVVTDENGCFSFSTQWVWGHKLLVYPDAFHGDSDNIRVTAYETWTDMEAGIPHKPWPVDLHHMSENATAVVVVDIKEDDVSGRIFAWSNWIVSRLEDELEPGLSGFKVLRVVSGLGTPYDPNKGVALPDTIWLAPDHTHSKFIVAHEIGHWLEQNWIEESISPSYQYPAIDDPCKFNSIGSNDLHGIRSAEFGLTSVVEGFAQYIATWVFDDPAESDAIFKYYKDIANDLTDYNEFEENGSLVSALGGSCDQTYIDYPDSCPPGGKVLGGENAWVEFMCPNDWAYDLEEISTELDWLRFFWQFSSADASAPGPVASMREILELIDLTGETVPDWAVLDATISDPANTEVHDLEARFDYLTLRHGVTNGE